MSLKTWIVILLIALIGSNVFWLIQMFDAGISYTYLDSSLDTAERRSEAAIEIANMNLVGVTQEEALAQLKALEPQISVFWKEQENCIYAAGVCVFINSAGNVQEVK
jgi:hypothetical protein